MFCVDYALDQDDTYGEAGCTRAEKLLTLLLWLSGGACRCGHGCGCGRPSFEVKHDMTGNVSAAISREIMRWLECFSGVVEKSTQSVTH